jgi:hypothetical protein
MKALWLTYSWKDNVSHDVDFVAYEIESTGITVRLDRWDLTAGKRLWEQIGHLVSDPNTCDSWALYATQDSLLSEPCKEELYYALDRALSTRGQDFPIIGIFPHPIDKSLIPPVIRTRLYVSLTDPDWQERVRAATLGDKASITRPKITPYELRIHQLDSVDFDTRAGLDGKSIAIEVRPRAGVWAPFLAVIPASEKDTVNPELRRGPRGRVPEGCVLHGGRPQLSKDGDLWGMNAMDEATPTQSYYLVCAELPSRFKFGVNGNPPQYEVTLESGCFSTSEDR